MFLSGDRCQTPVANSRRGRDGRVLVERIGSVSSHRRILCCRDSVAVRPARLAAGDEEAGQRQHGKRPPHRSGKSQQCERLHPTDVNLLQPQPRKDGQRRRQHNPRTRTQYFKEGCHGNSLPNGARGIKSGSAAPNRSIQCAIFNLQFSGFRTSHLGVPHV